MSVAWMPAQPYFGLSFKGSPESAEERMRSQLRELNPWEPMEGEVVAGDPARKLLRFAAELDLLLVGSRSDGVIGRLLDGSISDYLARRSDCPLLVMPRSAERGAHGVASVAEEPRATPSGEQARAAG
jgi:hypothetical protein